MSRKTTAMILLVRAYIDPGTGWIIVSSVLGVVTAIGYAIRNSVDRLKGLFSFSSGKAEANSDIPDITEPVAEQSELEADQG